MGETPVGVRDTVIVAPASESERKRLPRAGGGGWGRGWVHGGVRIAFAVAVRSGPEEGLRGDANFKVLQTWS